MDEQQRITWTAGIAYNDGREPVVLYTGPSHDEARSIARTYEDSAQAEGGRVVVSGLPEAEAA